MMVAGPALITPHLYTSGEFDFPIPEQALVLDTRDGLVVITGCSHPGIEAIVAEADRLQRWSRRRGVRRNCGCAMYSKRASLTPRLCGSGSRIPARARFTSTAGWRRFTARTCPPTRRPRRSGPSENSSGFKTT